MFYRQAFSAEPDTDPRIWTYVQVKDGQQRSALTDDPLAVFVRRPLMAIEFGQAWVGVTKLEKLKSFRGDPEMFFDLGAIYGMRKN
jgi:hypothetical protein